MIRIAAMIMVVAMAFTACGKQEPQPEVPPPRDLPGTLTGVAYATGGGMVAHTDFCIRVNREEIEYTSFWPLDEYTDEMEELTHVPIEEEQWTDIETVILDIYLDWALTDVSHETDSKTLIKDAFVLDGGDYTTLSLTWETENGPVEIGYSWPRDRRTRTLTDLLKELADPQGCEIVWYEEPQLRQIYFTRKHLINNKRDFSFQLYWTDYDEEDPYLKLIYYLGKYGAVAQDYVRMENADWDAFLTLVEETQLEYFPTNEESSDRFECRLNYTDDSYKSIKLNKDTEERLKDFFMGLIEQSKEA